MPARRLGTDTGNDAIGYGVALAGVAAAVIHAYVAFTRVVDTPEAVATAINEPDWTGLVGSLLAQIALAAVGHLLIRASPRWLGWLLLVVGVATMVGYFINGDIPPGVYYTAWLVAGVTLVLSQGTMDSAAAHT